MAEEKPPLKLLVEPDEYLCTWLLPGPNGGESEHAGALDLRANRPPTGSVYGNIPIQWNETATGQRSAGFPQEIQLPRLRARLANGHDVDLIDASITYWFPEHGRISAGTAIVGAPEGLRGFGTKIAWEVQDEEQAANQSVVPTYSRVSAQVGALDAVAGAAPFSGWTFPKGGEGRHLEGDWTVSGNPDSSQKWSDDDVTVRLEYDAGIGIGNAYAFRFVVSPVVRIESREALTVRDWVDRWIVPLRRIVSIATGDAQPLTYLAVDASGVDRQRTHQRRQVYGSGITQEPYQSDHAAVRKSSTAVHIAVDGLSLLDMLRRWQGLEDDHHPLIETYGAMLSATDEHPRSRFLLLVQALEGLHGHETAAAYEERKNHHTEERKTLIEALQDADILNSQQLKFVKKNLTKNPPRGLNEALHHLLGELPVDLTPRLAACKLLTNYLTEAQGPEAQRVAYALSRVRNDLAHGNKGFDAYDLHETVRVLERIVRAHALRLLGCPEPVLERVCNLDQ